GAGFASATEATLPIHLAQDNIHASKNHDHIRYRVPQAHILKDGQVNETRSANVIAIWIQVPVADQIKAEFTLGRFNPPVSFSSLRLETAQLGFRIHDRASRNVLERLIQNLQRFPDFEDADHVAIENVAVLT